MKSITRFTKKWGILLSSAALILSTAIPCFASNIQIKLNGHLLTTPIAPVAENGTTLVPLRVISENLGATVSFEQKTKQITIAKDTQNIVLTLGQDIALVNNEKKSLGQAPKVLQNTTMVPLRFVSENLNCTVAWDQQTKLITITSAVRNELPIATLVIKDYGTITLELYPEMAPNTVNNFIALANSGFYDGLTFHRVISDFMIQGGDPSGNGTGGPGYSIAGEFSSNGFTQNTLSHTKGVISMARTYLPNSAGSQFFIMSADGTYLDGQYAAFGKVTSGLELIDQIQNVNTDASDKPTKDVVIQSLRVDTQGISYEKPITIQ